MRNYKVFQFFRNVKIFVFCDCSFPNKLNTLFLNAGQPMARHLIKIINNINLEFFKYLQKMCCFSSSCTFLLSLLQTRRAEDHRSKVLRDGMAIIVRPASKQIGAKPSPLLPTGILMTRFRLSESALQYCILFV